MYSIVKIYGGKLHNNETCSFDFTSKSYSNICGLMITGSCEVSLVFDNENKVFVNSINIETTKSTKPNRRAFLFSKNIKEDFLKGSITKFNGEGKVSVYLLTK